MLQVVSLKSTKHKTPTQFSSTYYSEANGPESFTLTHTNIADADTQNFKRAKMETKKI